MNNFNSQFLNILEFNWNKDSIPINIAPLINDNPRLQEEESFDVEHEDENLREISRDQAFISNLSYVSHDALRGGPSQLQEDSDNTECPRGFVAFKINQEPVYLRKSSLLWMLTTKDSKVSSDRLHRFIDEKRVQGNNHVMCGDFVMMESDGTGADRLCQVLGFKFLTGNSKFSAMSCPIEVDEEKARGVAVLCAFFQAENNVVTALKRVPKYVDMKKFKNHVTIKRDLDTDKITLL